MITTGFGGSARIDDDAGTPVGINVAVAAVTIADPQWVLVAAGCNGPAIGASHREIHHRRKQ